MHLIVIVTVIAAMLAVVRFAARRFERNAVRAGTWDAEGPLVETQGPPRSVRGGGMDERREVNGDWVAPVIRDRRPRQPPPAHDDDRDE